MIKKLLVAFGFAFCVSSAKAAYTPIRTVQISTAALSQQTGSFNVYSGTMSVSQITTLSGVKTITGTDSITFSTGSVTTATGTFTGALVASSNTLTTTSLKSTTTVFGPFSDKNGSAGTTYDYWRSNSSGTTSAPIWSHTGLILQSSFTTLTASSGTTSSSFAVLGASITITPIFSNSIFQITYTGELADSNPTGDSCFFTITRNGTNIAPGGGTNGIQAIITTLGASLTLPGNMGPIYDQPATTSSLNYVVKGRTSSGGSTCTVNSNGGAQFSVLEIGQ